MGCLWCSSPRLGSSLWWLSSPWSGSTQDVLLGMPLLGVHLDWQAIWVFSNHCIWKERGMHSSGTGTCLITLVARQPLAGQTHVRDLPDVPLACSAIQAISSHCLWNRWGMAFWGNWHLPQ